MSSASQTFLGGPLTTIYTPPASCSGQTPSVWGLCDEALSKVSCYWSLPTQCYPPSPSIHTWNEGLTYGNKYAWSPGVLPLGVSTQHTQSRGGISSVTGCYMGWYLSGYVWCTGSTKGTYVLDATTKSGSFTGVLPQIAVHWKPEDLSLFTPTSAPELPAATLLAYETSVAARSRAGTATSVSAHTSTSTQSTRQHHGTQHTSNTVSASEGIAIGLSTGAKAGIGVGVAVAVLIIVALGFFLLRRRKKQQAEQDRERLSEAQGTYPYVDGKSELPAREKRLQELAAEGGAQELGSGMAAMTPELPAPGRAPEEVSGYREPRELE